MPASPPINAVKVRNGIQPAALAVRGMSFKVLTALTVGVLLVHLVLLQVTAATLNASETRVLRPFTTRAIVLNPAVVAEAPKAETKAAVKPPAPVKKPVRPKPPPSIRTLPIEPVSISNVPEVPAKYEESAPENVAVNDVEVAKAPVPEPAASAAVPAIQPPESVPLAANAASAASAIATPYTVPGSIRLKYNVEGSKDKLDYHARAEMLWRQDGNTYDATLEVSAFLIGSRVRTSTGRLTAEGLQPTRFSDKYRTEVAAHFDREKQKVTFSANTPDVPLLPGMQDQLSVFVQLGAMLGGAPDRYPPGTKISFETIGPRAPETWVITIEGEEKLSLPGGDISAIKLSRGTQREFDQKAELWLAPTLGYLPVRIKLTERNGDFVDQVWRATEAP